MDSDIAADIGRKKGGHFMPDLMRNRVLNVARELAEQGAGHSQLGPLLERLRQDLKIGNGTEPQQKILTLVHDMFRDGELAWGWDFDNAEPPYFHIPVRPKAEESPKGGEKQQKKK